MVSDNESLGEATDESYSLNITATGGIAAATMVVSSSEPLVYSWTKSKLGGLELDTTMVVLVEVGAGCAMPTLRRMAEQEAQELSAPLIRINAASADAMLPHA